MITQAEVETKPVRLDLHPDIHKALRRQAADRDMSMAAFARLLVTEGLGFKDNKARDS